MNAERLIKARCYLDYVIVIRRSVLVGALVLFSLNAVIYGRDVSVYVLTALYESETLYWIVSAFFFLLYIVPTFVAVMLTMSINIDRRIEELSRRQNQRERNHE